MKLSRTENCTRQAGIEQNISKYHGYNYEIDGAHKNVARQSSAVSTHVTPAVDSQVELDSLYSYYVLVLLTITYTIAFIDRQLLNLFVEPIKTSFSLSDTQISLLQGLAFMVAYVTFGPLLGRWSDVGHRRNILALGASFWNLCTAASGLCPPPRFRNSVYGKCWNRRKQVN